MGKEWPEHVAALDHAVIVLGSDPEFNSLCLQGVTLVDDTVLHVEFAGRELVVDLPKAAREAFRVELPFGNFREAGGGTREPECRVPRSEEHTSELQYLMRISYAVIC